MEQAIKIAIENGWKPRCRLSDFIAREGYSEENTAYYFEGGLWADIYNITSDPLFWQAIGKGLGWYELNYKIADIPKKENGESPTYEELQNHRWDRYWHRFIDHLSEGKDIDSFFKNIMTP